jgi:hypothetical protein
MPLTFSDAKRLSAEHEAIKSAKHVLNKLQGAHAYKDDDSVASMLGYIARDSDAFFAADKLSFWKVQSLANACKVLLELMKHDAILPALLEEMEDGEYEVAQEAIVMVKRACHRQRACAGKETQASDAAGSSDEVVLAEDPDVEGVDDETVEDVEGGDDHDHVDDVIDRVIAEEMEQESERETETESADHRVAKSKLRDASRLLAMMAEEETGMTAALARCICVIVDEAERLV